MFILVFSKEIHRMTYLEKFQTPNKPQISINKKKDARKTSLKNIMIEL